MSSVIGQLDPGTTVVLANLVDRLGMDVNESGWAIGWVMECYEKGLLSKDKLDGMEMNWGNTESTAAMLRKIAHREGFGDLLAEGVKRAAERIGGDALNCAVKDPFNPEEVSTLNAKLNGRRQFDDSLCVCRFCMEGFQNEIDVLNAATGWNFTISEAMEVGRRIVNQLRVFNFRHGLTKEVEAPSVRYGSTPVDGPVKGISIMPHWDFIRHNYYQHMGWDPETGKPLPGTLRSLGLEKCIDDL
jgi:aldehyde:ferredoxin oxidoreductase